MRIAALYDVHAMPWALEAVLAEVDADAIVFGGDFIYGPYPREVLEHVRSLDATIVRGNCEESPTDWERERLSEEQLAWAAALPLVARIDGVLYCHATPTSNLPVTTASTPDEIVAEHFEGITGTVVIGHTHHQFDRRIGDLRVINAGSVGMPAEDDIAAFWTLVVDGEPRPMRSYFDVDRAARETCSSTWPDRDEFIAGMLNVPASREEHIRQLEERR